MEEASTRMDVNNILSHALSHGLYFVGAYAFLLGIWSVSSVQHTLRMMNKRFDAWDDRYDEWEDYFDDWDERIEKHEDDENEDDITLRTYVADESGDVVVYIKHDLSKNFTLIVPKHAPIRGRSILNVFYRRSTRSQNAHIQLRYMDMDYETVTVSIMRDDMELYDFLQELV